MFSICEWWLLNTSSGSGEFCFQLIFSLVLGYSCTFTWRSTLLCTPWFRQTQRDLICWCVTSPRAPTPSPTEQMCRDWLNTGTVTLTLFDPCPGWRQRLNRRQTVSVRHQSQVKVSVRCSRGVPPWGVSDRTAGRCDLISGPMGGLLRWTFLLSGRGGDVQLPPGTKQKFTRNNSDRWRPRLLGKLVQKFSTEKKALQHKCVCYGT